MKTMKRLIAVLLVLSLLFALSGCYVISAQRMRRVKGTYRLSQYTVTPKHERKTGVTAETINYIEDAEHLFEDYLVVTGEGVGYYVHKAAGAEPTVKKVSLSYEYEQDSNKVSYVSYGTVDEQSPLQGMKLGVTRGGLNYTKTAIDYTEPFTKRPMRTEGVSVRFERVDRDTDLDYVEEALGVHFTVE